MPSRDSADLDRLKSILLRRSVRFGDFTLASGQVSRVYVDCRLTTFFAEAMPLIGRVFLDKLRSRKWLPGAVGGLTMGADPIAFAIARESLNTGRPIHAFVVRKEPKKHGMQRFIEGIEETENLPVVIVEDVCTTGGSTRMAIQKALDAKMSVLGAICLVDREMGAPDLLKREFGCELESIFKLSDLRVPQDEPGIAARSVETSV
jgi:orotate phosphoribosyltransferase